MDEMTDGEVTLKLSLLIDAAKRGGEGAMLSTLARINGQQTCKFYQAYDHCGRRVSEGLGPVTVIVDRVGGVGSDYRGGSVLWFKGVPKHSEKYTLVVDDEIHRVVSALRRAGWDG